MNKSKKIYFYGLTYLDCSEISFFNFENLSCAESTVLSPPLKRVTPTGPGEGEEIS